MFRQRVPRQRCQRQRTHDRRTWPADMSVDGWSPNEDVVVMQFQRLVHSEPPNTAEQYCSHIGAPLCRVCIWRSQARQTNEGRHVIAAWDRWPHGLPRSAPVRLRFVGNRLGSAGKDNVTVVYPERIKSVHECCSRPRRKWVPDIVESVNK